MDKELLEKINKLIDEQIEYAKIKKEEKTEYKELKYYYKGRIDSLELLKIDLIAIL